MSADVGHARASAQPTRARNAIRRALAHTARRRATALLVALLSAVSVLVVVPLAAEAVTPPAVSATRDQYGFPDWYQDSQGTRIEPCLDVSDTLHCVVLASNFFNPLQPTSFPNNFPDEFFYNVTDSDKIATPGCPGAASPLAANPGTAFVRNALEGAFLNGAPAAGEQMVFGRIRIVVKGGLCPGQSYTFTHPYGTTTLTADTDGGIKPAAGTVDVGCVLFSPPATCNFNAATNSQMLVQGYLRWDPAVLPLADPGYLAGDVAVLHPITGGTNNNFTIVDDSTSQQVATTNLFTVSGRLAGPILPSTALLDFGGTQLGTTPNQTINLTNVDPAATTVTGVVSDNPAEFTVTGGTCTASPTLPQDQACSVQVTFNPSTTGLRTANLTVSYTDGVNPRPHSPITVKVQGTGSNAGDEPVVSVAVPNGTVAPDQSIDFGSVRVGVLSATQTATITNTGIAPLQISNLEFINTVDSFDSNDAAAFRIMNNTCAGIFIPAGGAASCTFGVAFLPVHNHVYAASLKISANTSGGPVQVKLNATGIGGVAAVSTGPDGAGPDGIDPNTGFPYWYQDEAGIRLGECIDPANPLCIVLPDDSYDGVNPLVGAPSFTNFPSEYFYFVSDSDIIDTPGCGASPPGKAFVRMATEAAFGGPAGLPVDGDQMVFGRIRFSVTSGLCAGQQYTFTYPYGQVTFTADSAGGIRRNAGTTDLGCFPVAPDVCNFAEPLQSPVLGGFLRQVSAPAGYLGDPNVLSAVTGAPYTAPGDATPANYFRISQGATVVGETDQFTVMGKMVGPMLASPDSIDFGTVEVLTSSPERTVTITNDGQNPTAVGTATLTGPTGLPTSDYTITNDGCIGQTLQPLSVNPSSNCVIKVRFDPQANGLRSATLNVNHAGLNNPLPVLLSGIGGAPPGEPAISANPPAATFPDLHIGDTSAPESIRVSNAGGTANLVINGASIDPVGAEFVVVNNGCVAPVAPGGECVIDVAHAPTTAGAHAGNLKIDSNVTAIPSLLVPLTGRGSTAVPAVAIQNDSAGFPAWFGDNNGIRLNGCYNVGNPQDPNCIVLADPGYNPANPLSFPGNFPSEFFYGIADSNLLSVPADPACGGAGGSALLRVALEGAFASGTPVAGQQIQFARIRYTIDGLCPNTTYVLVNPYKTDNLTTDGTGKIKSTVDLPAPLASEMLQQGFLRWDPNVSPAAPAGYLGDARSLHGIVGSTFRPAGPGTDPQNSFEIRKVNALPPSYANSTRLAETKDFIVSGRLAGPVTADKTSVTFGPQAQGSQSANQTVTLTNLQAPAIGSVTATIVGPDASDFSLAVPPAGTCTPLLALLQDQGCTVNVAFTPGAATVPGAKSASLVITHDGPGSPMTIPLSGTATVAGHPEISLSATSIAFGNQTVGVPSAGRIVTVTNTGTAPLTVNTITVGGTNAGDFTRTSNCLLALAPNGTCNISVVFNPAANGPRTATLAITSDDPTRPTVSVSLTGTGVSPIISMSPSTTAASPLSMSTGAGGSTSQTINVTNTGTAPLSLIGAPALVFGAQTVSNPALAPGAPNPLKFSATHNCNNIAAGGKCKITVTFTPGAGTRNQRFDVAMTVLSNAANGPQTVFLRGTRN